MTDVDGDAGTRTAPVSVVIPFYDGAATIGRAVASLVAQTVRPAEVVVVDDGSPDPFRPEGVPTGVPVRPVRHDRNRGIPAARNTGIRAAANEWIAFLDQDDEWAPDKLERQWQAVRDAGAHRELVVFGRLLMEGPGRAPHLRPPRRAIPAVEAGGDAAIRTFVRHGNVAPFVTLLLHRRVLDRHGYLDEGLLAADDTELVLRLLAASVPFRFAGAEGGWSAVHRFTGRNFSEHVPRWVGDQLRFIPELAARFDRIRPYRDAFLARAHYTLGRHHDRRGELPEAGEEYRRASRLDPLWWRPWIARLRVAAPRPVRRLLAAAWDRLERVGDETPPGA